jgi:hypothetical protein
MAQGRSKVVEQIALFPSLGVTFVSFFLLPRWATFLAFSFALGLAAWSLNLRQAGRWFLGALGLASLTVAIFLLYGQGSRADDQSARAGSISMASRAGDFNRDGRDDIVAFKRGLSPNVYVALSKRSHFSGTGARAIWRDDFAEGNQVPGVGDFNGDGRDDIVAFKRGSSGEVYVALSTGSEFRAPKKWRVGFAEGNQIPVPGNIW